MKKRILVWLLVVMGGAVAFAQNTTTLTGTVTDSDSQIWAGASWTATLYNPSGGTPYFLDSTPVPLSYSGTLDSTGSFQAGAVVGSQSHIVPSGTGWIFTVYSVTSALPSTITPVSVSGASYNMGAYLSSQIKAPRFNASNLGYAYNTTEVLNAIQGSGYVNTISKTSYLYNGQTWTAVGGGGGLTGPYNLTNQISTFANGLLQAVGNPYSASISCSAAGVFETGNVSTNPNSCTFGYANGTTVSASLTDGTHNVTLTTPYTSGALPYVYSTNTTFTLHATAASTQTATASDSISFLYREFAGVGAAGAASATAVGNNALLDTGDTLPSAGLGTHSTFGPFTPSGQKIYVLGLNSSCTFTSGGFAFPMNAPVTFAFVNQYGQSVNIYDYESVNLLSAPFTLNGNC